MGTNELARRDDIRHRRGGLRPGRERGQSLIVAVIVMFVLLFIGAIFVALVARNLQNTGRARETVSAEEFAAAGIQYCDDYLQHSPDGADWRPAPTKAVNPNDPDKLWLDAGYTRVDLGNGRALVRVTYQPAYMTDPNDLTLQKKVVDPLGKYIKIESVGRTGFLNPQDPTTFLNTPAPRLRREYVAYKSIGITDYLRFVTNKTNETKAVAILGNAAAGVPVAVQYGGLPVRTLGTPPSVYHLPGAPMRFNCGLQIPANRDFSDPNGGSDTIFALDRRNGDSILVSGDVTEDTTKRPTFLDLETGQKGAILPSSDPNFTTFNAMFRDASPNPDPTGHARGISRLEPPVLDAVDPSTNLTRYRELTRESGLIVGPNGNQINTGRFGFGAGIYIDNNDSIEGQSRNVSGGQTARSIWFNPRQGTWNGHLYTPPGALVEIGYPVAQQRDATGNLVPGQFVRRPGLTILRDDRREFRDPNGNILPHQMTYAFFIYKPANGRPVIKVDNDNYRAYLKTLPQVGNDEAAVDRFLPEFNGVIYAEGNLRVKGLLPNLFRFDQSGKPLIPIRREQGDNDNLSDIDVLNRVNPPSLSLVSGANIHIEGSVVRETPQLPLQAGSKPTIPSIALLAVDNVVVNSTQFFAPNRTDVGFTGAFAADQPPFHAELDVSSANETPPFALQFAFGDDYRDNNGNPRFPIYFLARQSAPPSDAGGPISGSTYINYLINAPFATTPDQSLYQFSLTPANVAPGYPTWVYPLMSTGSTGVAGVGSDHKQPGEDIPQNWLINQTFRPAGLLEQWVFQLEPRNENRWGQQVNHGTYRLFLDPGVTNLLRPNVDPNFTYESGVKPYRISQAAVAPFDVRIEAVMYAQNGSFYVIPGYTLNYDPSDTRDQALNRAAAAGLPAGTMLRPAGTSDYFPFYGEPFDCRITIVGAIAENRTASLADQSAWMHNWGYIPQVFGSTDNSPYMQSMKGPGAQIPLEHLNVDEIGMNSGDQRLPFEQNAFGNGKGLTRGLRFLYDPALAMPYTNYDPNAGTLYKSPDLLNPWVHVDGGGLRQDDLGRVLPPMPRLPVCPGFVFYGEVR